MRLNLLSSHGNKLYDYVIIDRAHMRYIMRYAHMPIMVMAI